MIRHQWADDLTVLEGDVRETLKALPDESVQCVVTSPPYWGLRDYGVPGQLGLEPTPEEFVANMVAVFREVRRVLRKDGTLWLNLGDSYNGSGGAGGDYGPGGLKEGQPKYPGRHIGSLKPGDLVGIPWLVALALRSDGWVLRSDVIWSKPNPMPESVEDRPTKAHEYLFLLSKSWEPLYWIHRDGRGTRVQPAPDYRWIDLSTKLRTETDVEPPDWREATFTDKQGNKQKRWKRINLWKGHDYFYDVDAVREPHEETTLQRAKYSKSYTPVGHTTPDDDKRWRVTERKLNTAGRNKRTVWEVATQPFPEAHFATYPPKLIEPCILAGTSPKACPKCRAPWERVTGEPIPVEGRGSGNKERKIAKQGERSRTNTHMGSSVPWKPTVTPTISWQPTCTCEDNDGSGKCIVLDPFGGSGTTAEVALQHGRAAILCELNPEYIQIMKRRIYGTQQQFAL